MFCSYCGSENVNDAKFCNSCGKNIQQEPVNLEPDIIKQPTLGDDKPIPTDGNQSSIDKSSSKITVSQIDTVKAKEQGILTSEESTDIVEILTNLVNYKDGKISRNTYILNHIPKSKLDNAARVYVPETLSGNPIVLHDETAFGNSKIGFILTTNFFYSYLSKKDSFKKVKYAIPLNEITNIELKPNISKISDDIDLIINNQEIGRFNQFDKKDIKNICFILKQLIQNPNKLQSIPPDLFECIDENKWVIEKENFEDNTVNKIKSKLTTKNIMIFLGLWALVKLFSFGGPEDMAANLLRETMKSPDSFVAKNTRIMWEGKDNENRDAYVIRVSYTAKNSFGASLQDCKMVAISVGDGKYFYNKRLAFDMCGKEGDPLFNPKMIAKTMSSQFKE